MSADEFDTNRRGVLSTLMASAVVWSAPAIATLASPASAQSDAVGSSGSDPGDGQSSGSDPGDGQSSGSDPGDGQSSGSDPGDGQSSGSDPDTGNSTSGFSSGQGQGLGNRGAGAQGKGQGVNNGRAFGD